MSTRQQLEAGRCVLWDNCSRNQVPQLKLEKNRGEIRPLFAKNLKIERFNNDEVSLLTYALDAPWVQFLQEKYREWLIVYRNHGNIGIVAYDLLKAYHALNGLKHHFINKVREYMRQNRVNRISNYFEITLFRAWNWNLSFHSFNYFGTKELYLLKKEK